MRLSDLSKVVESTPIPSSADLLSKVQAFEKGPLLQKMIAYTKQLIPLIKLEMDGDGYLKPALERGVTIDYENFYGGTGAIRGVNGFDEADEIIKYSQREKIQLLVGIHSVSDNDDFYSPEQEKVCIIRKNPSGEGLLISFDGESVMAEAEHDLQAFLDAVDSTIVGRVEFPDYSWQGPTDDDPDGNNQPTEVKEMYLALAYKHLSHD